MTNSPPRPARSFSLQAPPMKSNSERFGFFHWTKAYLYILTRGTIFGKCHLTTKYRKMFKFPSASPASGDHSQHGPTGTHTAEPGTPFTVNSDSDDDLTTATVKWVTAVWTATISSVDNLHCQLGSVIRLLPISIGLTVTDYDYKCYCHHSRLTKRNVSIVPLPVILFSPIITHNHTYCSYSYWMTHTFLSMVITKNNSFLQRHVK